MPESKPQSSGLLASMGDLFGKPVFLNLRKNQAVSTSLGGLLSLILILIMIAQGVFAIIQMTQRQQPQIVQLNEAIEDPPNVPLNQSNNFNFAISTSVNGNPVNMTTSSVLTFTASSNLYLRNEDDTRTKYTYQINFSPCESSDFSDSIFGAGTYDLYQISYAYCPRNISYMLPNGTCPTAIEEMYPNCVSPPAFNISGSYLSPLFSFIQFSFSLCDNTNPNTTNPYGMQCMNLSDIYPIFNNDIEAKVNFYFANNLINPVVYETPNETYLDLLYWDVNPRLYKVSDIYLDEEIVQDYASYYISSNYTNQSFYSIDSNHLREQQSYLFNNWTNQSLLQFNIRRNVLNSVTTRVYMKIQDVMSNLGGLAKSIMVAFAFIAIGYAMFKYQMVVSNELYDFEPVDMDKDSSQSKRQSKEKIKKMNFDKSLNEMNLKEAMIKQDFIEDSQSREIDEVEEEKEKVKSYFRYQQKKQRRLKYNELVYLKSLLCCRKQNAEEKLAVKARNQVEEDVDLIQILQKLKEVDKLKIVLMDRNQRELFDYIPKPLLSKESDQPLNTSFDLSYIGPGPDAEREMRGVVPQQNLFDSLPKYAKLYVSYRNAKDNKDPLKQNHNRKLLTMLGPDLIRVFEHVDKELGNRADPDLFEAIIKRVLIEDHSFRNIKVEL